MKIKHFKGHIMQPESYQITISMKDGLNPNEILNCFKSQYPKTECVIISGYKERDGFVSIEVAIISDRLLKLKAQSNSKARVHLNRDDFAGSNPASENKSNSRRKKDESDGSNVIHLETRSNAEEEDKTGQRSVFADNHAERTIKTELKDEQPK